MKRIHLILTILVSSTLITSCNQKQEILTPRKNKTSEKWGYVNEKGKEKIPFKYDFAKDFSEGLAKVGIVVEARIGRDTICKYGYVNKKGKEVIPLKYCAIGDFSEGLAKVVIETKGQWNELIYKRGYIDKTGKEVISPKYDGGGSFSEGLAKIRVGGEFSVRRVSAFTSDDDVSDDYVIGDARYGYVDKTGKEIIPAKYTKIGDFSEGLAKIELNGKYGYVDITGKEIIPPKYANAEDFSEGMARVTLDAKTDYINKNGISELCKTPLISCITQIDNYYSQLNKSSRSFSSFAINRPYLVITAKSNKCEDISFVTYSENKFNNQSINNLKTLIIRYDYPDFTETYGRGAMCLTSYGSYLIYFDMDKKECIGYDNMQGRNLPKTAPAIFDTKGFESVMYRYAYWNIDEIIEKIESHLIITETKFEK